MSKRTHNHRSSDETGNSHINKPHDHDRPEAAGVSRRNFLKGAAAGMVASGAAGQLLAHQAAAQDPGTDSALLDRLERSKGDGSRRILIKNGIVLSLDPSVGDFEKADVLIEGKKILAVGPDLDSFGEVIDASGMIVMPGFITTHHHQYETLQRAIIPDGVLGISAGENWPSENYITVVQQIWTAGLIPGATPADPPVWDLGRVPYDPEDNYISELVSSLSELTYGITMGTDTSQASHTPEHTDAMIQALVDSGRRMVFDYTGGIDRSPQGIPYEYPGAIGNTTSGIGRLAKQYFNSKDQLVTLGFAGGPTEAFPGAGYTGWQLGRAFSALINNHNVGSPQTVIDAAADPRNGTDWSDVTFVHCVRWQDKPISQISYDPVTGKSTAWEIWRDRGAHSSIAVIIEMQMRHGMPPLQMALDHGIMPSLSPDVDTNMTPDPFSLMRGAFCLQRVLANDLAFPLSNPQGLPLAQVITSRQVIEMCTIAGAAANRVLDKVGTLTPGKEADIVMLSVDNLNLAPINNVPGAIVTMMNPNHVQHVMVAGQVKVWNGKLVGWDVRKLVDRITSARDRVLARINGPALVGAIPRGDNSFSNPYRPNFLGSCCFNGQNTTASPYVLRP